MIYLYDAISNVKTPTSYKLLEGITGIDRKQLAVYKCRGSKIGVIDSYIVDDKTTKDELYELMLKQKPENEIWKKIDKDDKDYEISNYGRVRSFCYGSEPKLLRPFIRKNKWLVVKIHSKEKMIHMLVAHAFLEVPKGMCVYHKNGNILKNYVENLGFATRKELGKMFGGDRDGIPVSKIDLKTGEVIENYDNMAVAGRENFMHKESIGLAIQENRPSCGYGWVKCEDFNERDVV